MVLLGFAETLKHHPAARNCFCTTLRVGSRGDRLEGGGGGVFNLFLGMGAPLVMPQQAAQQSEPGWGKVKAVGDPAGLLRWSNCRFLDRQVKKRATTWLARPPSPLVAGWRWSAAENTMHLRHGYP